MTTERSDADFPAGPLSDAEVRDLAQLMSDVHDCGAWYAVSAHGTQIHLPDGTPELTRQRLHYYRHDARQLIADALTDLDAFAKRGERLPYSILERARDLAQIRALALVVSHLALARTLSLPAGWASTWERDRSIIDTCVLLSEAERFSGAIQKRD